MTNYIEIPYIGERQLELKNKDENSLFIKKIYIPT
jgi:hypothetical protein